MRLWLESDRSSKRIDSLLVHSPKHVFGISVEHSVPVLGVIACSFGLACREQHRLFGLSRCVFWFISNQFPLLLCLTCPVDFTLNIPLIRVVPSLRVRSVALRSMGPRSAINPNHAAITMRQTTTFIRRCKSRAHSQMSAATLAPNTLMRWKA